MNADKVRSIVRAPDLARKYEVTSQTVLEWFHQGVIPAVVAVGKIYRFDEQEVEQALRQAAVSRRGQLPQFAELL